MRFRLALFLLLLFLVLPRAASAQDRYVEWERWDVLIDNIDTTDNQFNVSETHEVRFVGTFSVGLRDLFLQYVENIRDIRVFQDNQPLRESCSEQPGTFCLTRTSDAISIEYYFNESIRNRTETFRIEYTVVGAIRRYDTGDLIGWTVVPADHFGFYINSSTITIEMPDDYAPREGVDPIETYGAPAEISVRGSTITATTTRTIGGSEDFNIGLQFPHDPRGRIPSWQADYDRQQEYDTSVKPIIDLVMLGVSALIFGGGPLLIFFRWYNKGRDPKVLVPEYLSEPPSDLRPAVVGALVDERADLRDVMSIVVDLAQRGYIVMEEERQPGMLGIGTVSTFTFKRTDQPTTDLKPFEANMISRLFANNASERTLESLKYRFYQYIPLLEQDLYRELVSEGLFTVSPNTTRGQWMGIGIALIALAFFGLYGAAELFENITGLALLVVLAVGFTGFVALGFANFMPSKTRKGAEEAAKWRAFYRYMQNLEKYTTVEEAAQRFDAYLPYAVAFGLDKTWLRKFSQLDYMPIPTWYYPTYMGGPYSGGYRPGTPLRRIGAPLPGSGSSFSLDDMSRGVSGGLQAMSDGLNNLLNSASRAMTARPQQSSSGRWSSGGRTFGGGGFRGGGFSGGGRAGFR
jgi:uncharacterized membrane protein